jgi:hypothetical protein
MIHLFGSFPASEIDGLEVYGNIFFPGSEGVLQPGWTTLVAGGEYEPEGSLQVGDRTVTTADHGTFIIVDARTSAATLTLGDPTTAGVERDVQVQSWFTPTAGLVIANGGFSLYDLDNATTITSFTFAHEWETIQLRADNALARWEILRIGASYQGFQTNVIDAGISGLNIHHNIFWLNGNAVNIDAGAIFTGTKVEKNTFMPVWPNNGRGVAGYNPQGRNPFIRLKTGSGHRTAGNICGTIDAVAGEVVDGNVKQSELNLNDNWLAMADNFSVPNVGVEEVNPTTVAQAIAYARPKAALPSGIGALAVSSADDEYVFFDGTNAGSIGLATNTPWFVTRLEVSAIGGGFYAEWLPPGYTGHGAITSYDCEYRINGGSWTGATEVGTTALFDAAAVDDVVDVRVRAVNANGAGKWTVAPAVTVATPLVPIPTFTELLNSTGTASIGDITTPTFVVSATKLVLVVIHLRNRTNGETINSCTIGASGRPYGDGTALTLLADASLTFNDARVLIYRTTISAGTYTVMMDRVLSSNGHRVSVYETDASDTGATAVATGVASPDRSISITTTASNSLILHAATVDYNGGSSASISDDALYGGTTGTIHWSGASTEEAAAPGTYGATVTTTAGNRTIAIASVELLA